MKRPTLNEDPIEHINWFFKDNKLPFSTDDVVRLKNMKVGKRQLSMQQQIDELGGKPSRSTLYSWHLHLS